MAAVVARTSSSQNWHMMRKLSSMEFSDPTSDLVRKLPPDRLWKFQRDMKVLSHRYNEVPDGQLEQFRYVEFLNSETVTLEWILTASTVHMCAVNGT